MKLISLAAALLLTSALAPAAAWASAEPVLDQVLDELPIVHGERVLNAGHVDMGPKYHNGQWRFLIHDDVARADANAESVWRYPDETVFHVLDEARLAVPEDPAYEFLGAEPGSDVWVVPQTQDTEVVWLGWNTQDPEVMSTIDRGITLSLTGVQGPGIVNVYLQSGSFGEPQVLWDSRVTGAQPIWVDVNTHTHANWVFTEPGIYLLELEASAELIDGSTVTDTQQIRFAVGAETSTEEALAASWASGTSDAEGPTAEPEGAETTAVSENPFVPILIGAIIFVAVLLIAGISIAVVRSSRAKRLVLASRTASGPDEGRGE